MSEGRFDQQPLTGRRVPYHETRRPHRLRFGHPLTAHPSRTGHPGLLGTLTILLSIITIPTVIGCTKDASDRPDTTPSDARELSPDDSVVDQSQTDDSSASDVVDLELTGPPVEIPEHFFGFNAASIVSPANVEAMLDPDLWSRLRDFPTRLIRIPSGTAAQWIDWRTGRFLHGPGSPFADVPTDRRGVTMTDWARLVEATGAEPVWDLNVVNSTLADQMEMLSEAQLLGMPVRLIELGNEPWDIRGPYLERFPTGASYAEEMNRWIPVIRSRFPDARIAVAGADRADSIFMTVLGDRYANWNDEVLSTIHDADAIVVHQYWGLPDNAAPGSDVDQTLSAGLDHWSDMRRLTLDPLGRYHDDGSEYGADTDLEVWVTEWNQAAHFAPPGRQIWAQALSVIMVAMEHALDPGVTMSLVHNVVDGVGNPHDIGPSMVYPSFTNGENGTDRFGRTSLGSALPLLFGAADGNTISRRITPTSTTTPLSSTAATSDGPEPIAASRSAIRGIVFYGTRTDVVLVNRTDVPLRIRLPRPVARELGDDSTMIEIHTAADAPLGWEPSTRSSTTVTRLDDPSTPVTLPAFSITRLIAAEA